MDEHNLVEQLRQSLNNISLAASNIEEHLKAAGKVDTIVERFLTSIRRNVTRMDNEMVEAYEQGRLN